MTTLKISPGIDGIPTNTIPDDPAEFTSWFKNVFLRRWAANADTRNAISGVGISITGDIASPATIAVSTELQSLFAQPYVLVGGPAESAALTDYRSIAAEVDVLTLSDGGAESSITIGVAVNGIGDTQLRQSGATSVIGNANGSSANVADIAAGGDNTVLARISGALEFSAVPLAAIAQIGSNTVLGNITAGSAAPIALTQSQLTALVIEGNPTAKVGLAAVNGSALTFMTSDSSPPIDQTIAPTWSGLHTFANVSTVFGGTSSVGLIVDATNTSTTSAQFSRYRVNAGSTSLSLLAANQNQAAAVVTNGPATPQAAILAGGAYPIVFGINGTYVGEFTSTGLAVAGTLAVGGVATLSAVPVITQVGTATATTVGGVALAALAKGFMTITVSGTNYGVPYFAL